MNKKRLRSLTCVCLGVMFVFCGSVNCLQAEENSVNIEVDPDIRKIELGKNRQEIALVARSTKQNLVFEWSLRGPGELQGDIGSPGIFYVPPEKIEGESAEQATIILKVRDEQGNSIKKSVIFKLFNPSGPPTPTPFPTATPTPFPTPTPTPFPTATPTPFPTATPTPTPESSGCPEDSRGLEELIQQSLPEELRAYKSLQEQENNGKIISERQLSEVLENIICDLTAIEKLLQENYTASGDAAILDRIRKIQKTREQYEQALLNRRRQHQI